MRQPRFTPGKGPPVPIVQEAGWTPEPVWTQRLEGKSLAPAGNLTSIARSFPSISFPIIHIHRPVKHYIIYDWPTSVAARSRRRFAAAWLLGSRIRIPLRAWMFVSCVSMLCCPVQVEASATG
jgi:hypothetical protein